MTTEPSNISMIDLLPQDVQDTVYLYKHQLEFIKVLKQLNRRFSMIRCRYCGCKPRYDFIYRCDDCGDWWVVSDTDT